MPSGTAAGARTPAADEGGGSVKIELRSSEIERTEIEREKLVLGEEAID